MPYINYADYIRQRNLAVDANDANWFQKTNPVIELDDAEKQLELAMSAHRQLIVEGHEKYDLCFPPAQPFYKVKNKIEQTKLFEIFRNMPKGGQLHMHTSACASAEWILDTLKNNDYSVLPRAYIYIAPKNGITAFVDRQLAFLNNPMENFINAKDALQNPEFYDDMLDRMTFRSDRIEHIPYIWDEFNRIFAITDELLKNINFYTMYYTKAFRTLIQDNINYLELRTGFASFNRSGVSDNLQPNNGNPQQQIQLSENQINESLIKNDYLFLDTLKSIAIQLDEEANPDRFILKIILCGNRAKNRMEDARTKMARAHMLRNSDGYRDFVIGFDLVGEEDRGSTTEEFARIIIDMGMDRDTDTDRRLDFYFHDGESNWTFNSNIIDAYMIGNKRIGHGFNLSSYPDTLEQLHLQHTNDLACPRALEICPISNQMLRYTPDLRTHPAYSLLKRGIECVICNDDPQLFMNQGLSYDFWMIYVAFNLNLAQIKRLIVNSYICSAMTEQDKAIMLADFMTKWDNFVPNATIILNTL